MARTERSEGSAIHTSGAGGLQDRRHSRLLLSLLGLRFGAFPTLEPRRIDRPVTERTEIEKSSISFSGFGSGDAHRRRATTSTLFAKPLRTEPKVLPASLFYWRRGGSSLRGRGENLRLRLRESPDEQPCQDRERGGEADPHSQPVAWFQ